MAVEFAVVEADSGSQTYLQQYYRLREECFRRELGLSDFDGSEEAGDRSARIFLAISRGKCLGGVRITPQTTLQSQVQQLNIDIRRCCTWERFAIDPAVRTIEFFQQFCGQLAIATRESGFKHAMVLSSLRNARFYRKCHSSLGIDFHIHRPVPHCAGGQFAGLEHYLSVAHLHSVASAQAKLAV